MKLVIDNNIPFIRGIFEPYFDEVLYLPGSQITKKEVKNANALLIRTRTKCDKNLLEESTVSFIGSATIGFDHIDTSYCAKRGIKWANSPGCNADGVLQWIVATLFKLAENNEFSLKGKVLGVVGVGNVGKKVVQAAKSLGMNVICSDPPRARAENISSFVNFDTIAEDSDIITFHVPLTLQGEDSTWHMAGSNFFQKVKPNTLLINTSRGEVIDSFALLDAFNTEKISSFALDVWENEPNISPEILKLSSIATPHIAGYSLEGKVIGTKMVVDQLSEFFNLGLHPWFPNPNPITTKLPINHPVSVLDAVIKTYNIDLDDFSLRSQPENFEDIRNNYTYRRDFTGYEVSTQNEEMAISLKELGFQVNSK